MLCDHRYTNLFAYKIPGFIDSFRLIRWFATHWDDFNKESLLSEFPRRTGVPNMAGQSKILPPESAHQLTQWIQEKRGKRISATTLCMRGSEVL